MSNSQIDVEKYVHEVNDYVNQLAIDLDHPKEQQRVLIIWRAVMHSIRDRITISESFDLMAPLPLTLRGIYTTGWKYTESPPYDYKTVDEMKEQVESLQSQYGEQDFNWSKSTEDIISIVLDSLERYYTEGQMDHIRSQLPKDLKFLV